MPKIGINSTIRLINYNFFKPCELSLCAHLGTLSFGDNTDYLEVEGVRHHVPDSV